MDYATGLPYLRIGKELSVDFKTRLLMFTNWKGTSYDSILAIVDRLIKRITRLNCGYQKEPSALACDIANPFLPDL